MDQKMLNKQWPNSQLNTAISCLTYGINCLYYQKTSNKLIPCLLSIHEQYINIVHVIVGEKGSFLFELQNVKSISNKDISVKKSLKALNFEHFIIIHTSTLQSYVIVMHSQNQINVLWEGLQYFVYEAFNFYSRISLMDPFKAETAMIFMNADADGSKLLDIEEVLNIFEKLRINKSKQEIENSILEINEDLYQKQNLKKPKGFQNNMLTPLGFEYILQFYSLKISVAPLFTEFCPIFKFKHKNTKKSIIDILKSQFKPLMSGVQFQQFLQKYLKINKTQQQCTELIKTFPIYDGQGKQIPQQSEFLSYHNFCNFVFSPTNCIIDSEKTKIYQDMDLPLNEYFIYASSTFGYDSHFESLLHFYEISLKKGCRCLQIDIHIQKQEVIVKAHTKNKSYLLSDVLKTIKNVAFSFNPFPLILSVQCNFLTPWAQKVAKIFKTELGEHLSTVRNKDEDELPSPLDLRNKIILQLIGNTKRSKEEENAFMKLVTLTPNKLDFERKGQTCWDTCQISTKDILKYEEIEDKNLSDYCRKVIVRTSPDEKTALQAQNFDPMPMFRNGVQLVCLNLQKQDANHYLVHSKFIENGGKGCGYLMKPYWMKSKCLQSQYASTFTRPLCTLRVKVYSAQKYILIDTSSPTFTLNVYIKGSKLQEQKNKKYKSQPKTEGFYSDFQLECQFSIYCFDLAMLVFNIVDEKEKILAFRALSINAIREGLRIVELLGPGMQLNQNSCLLVETSIVEERKKRKPSNMLG